MNIFQINILKATQISFNPQKHVYNCSKIDEQVYQQNQCFQPDDQNQVQNQQKNHNKNQQNLKSQWTQQQQIKLYKLHDKIGNKWAIISEQLPGKTDNSVKNYFYSKLRKGLRRLNKIIHQKFKKQLQQIKVIVIYKIIQATQQKFKDTPFCNPEVSDYCIELKNRVLSYSDDENQFSNYQKYPSIANELISDLINFSKQYKRKAKKMRKNSVQQTLLLPSHKIQSSKNTNSQYQWSQVNSIKQSDASVINSIPSSLHNYDLLKIQEELPIRRRAKSKQQIFIEKQQIQNDEQDAISQKMQVQDIEQIFKESGIFQDEFLPPIFEILKKPSQCSYRMDGSGQTDNFHYFEQSAIQMRLLPIRNLQDSLKNNTLFN